MKPEEKEHKCVFQPALDLSTLQGWQECKCGKKRKNGFPYFRDKPKSYIDIKNGKHL